MSQKALFVGRLLEADQNQGQKIAGKCSNVLMMAYCSGTKLYLRPSQTRDIL